MPWYSRPSSRAGDTASITASIDGHQQNGSNSLISKLSSRTLGWGIGGDSGSKAREASVSEFGVETLHASFDLVTPREAYNGEITCCDAVVLKTKIPLEDTEIWVKFAGYTKVEGQVMKFVEVDKMLRKTKSIQSGKRETHMFALQFPATNLPPTCDKPYVHYELVSELRANTEGNQTVIKSKPHELVFIPLLDPVLLETTNATPGSPVTRNTIMISQDELADSSAPTPDNGRGGILPRVSSLRKATTNNSFSPNAPKRTETFRGLTKRQLTVHDDESTSPVLDLKMNVEDSQYRPGSKINVSYRIAAQQAHSLPKGLTLSIVSHQYLSRGSSLEPINQSEVVTKVLATNSLVPQPTHTASIDLPDEASFRKRNPFLPTASLPFGTCTTLDNPISPPGTSSTSSTSALKGKTVLRNPRTDTELRFIIRHSVNLTAHFKGEPDHTIEVPIAIGNQKARKLKAPAFSITFHGEGTGSSTGSTGGSSSNVGLGKDGKDVFSEKDVGWDGRGQFPTLENGGMPYYREDAADEIEEINWE